MAEQSLEQQRAKHALAQVREIKTPGHYTSYVKSLPPTILQIGLGQAFAVIRSRQGKHVGYKVLYAHLNDWLTKEWPNKPDQINDDILDFLVSTNEQTYLRIQDETIAYLRWLKKFAVAFVAEPGGDQDATPSS